MIIMKNRISLSIPLKENSSQTDFVKNIKKPTLSVKRFICSVNAYNYLTCLIKNCLLYKVLII